MAPGGIVMPMVPGKHGPQCASLRRVASGQSRVHQFLCGAAARWLSKQPSCDMTPAVAPAVTWLPCRPWFFRFFCSVPSLECPRTPSFPLETLSPHPSLPRGPRRWHPQHLGSKGCAAGLLATEPCDHDSLCNSGAWGSNPLPTQVIHLSRQCLWHCVL